ncbi:putative periplasmic serine endoprotease DegP-like precursor [Novipirellula aureliae]|uniref:Putative periplasmic serine endoprotease DegP-like n=1 Tax=Novipirellula aureliae TaxID=2527966 RepID=A0A5C6E939_9BACT|nr:PDZ domain-containing protein [Novipirellula aureliae]TWU44407.1 putative periplasmic serine endoprotease DegP-like precursor [Novipirellula aureliae]
MTRLRLHSMGSVFALAGALTFAIIANGQENAGTPSTKTSPPVLGNETTSGAHADHDSPQLGVMVGSCPGKGVCVLDTIAGGPAERAGIRPGDYILAINDQEVRSPQDLKQKIDNLERFDTIDVSLWRQGKYVSKDVPLASQSKELPPILRGWLGVMLSDSEDDQNGVVIQQVHPNSPAAQAGLQSGDEVKKINGEAVASIDAFVDKVSDFEPGTKVTFSIIRNDKEQNITAVLGEISNAPMSWFRRSMRMPMGGPDFNVPPFPPLPGVGVMDDVIDELREQIRTLRKDVEQLKRTTEPSTDKSRKDAKDATQTATPAADSVSYIDIPAPTFLAQYDASRGFPPNISNDWTGSRYQNRNADREYRYRTPYRRTYRYPYNPYRYYPYRYYNYGGWPYYYGGGYPYGFRGGVQIGPNFGVYW